MEKSYFELKTPDLGDTDKIELVTWYAKPGEKISIGQEVLELVTDKAAFPMESPRNGRLERVNVPEGAVVKKGDVLGVLELENE
jgi:pyruvate/2-oxoglutarate dehydrogenase complex dihydrolipoamide acyltransferase (E2) component